MTKNLTEILKKDAAELSESEQAELQAGVNQLTDEQKEQYAEVLKDVVTPAEDEEEEDPDTLEVKAVYDSKTKLAVASTDVVDRHGERINQEGWDLKAFKKNPVMLWGHDHSEIAVGNARNIHIERAGGKPRLVFTPDFHEKTEKARALKSLFDEGWLNSFSVGFIPKEFDGKESTYLKQELLEISAVNVPANHEATMLAYKSLVDKGIKKKVAKDVLDLDEEPTAEVKASLVEIMKGALADEIEQNEELEAKWKNMEKVHDIYWAFCDVYYDEETDVEDFEKLVGELITELGKVSGEPQEESLEDIDPDKLTIDQAKTIVAKQQDEKIMQSAKEILLYEKRKEKTESPVVLDSIPDNVEDDNKTAKTQDNKDTSVAPTLSPEARAKQSLSKVIAKASDKILEDKSNKDTVKYAKVIKRAAEILNKAHKIN